MGENKKPDTPEAAAEEAPAAPTPAAAGDIAPAEDYKARFEEMNDKYLRALAEMENFKKRMLRDRQEERAYAGRETVLTFLPVVDNLARALDAALAKKAKDEVDPLLDQLSEGVDLTLKQFDEALKRLEVTPITAEIGKPFDPSMHQALFQEEHAEYEEGAILEVLQRGYMLKDRVIRPSMVKVSRKP